MICQYLEAALERAHYEIIDDEEPHYGEVSELPGVWASGRSLEECRRNLAEVIEGRILLRLSRGMAIPHLGETWIELPKEVSVA